MPQPAATGGTSASISTSSDLLHQLVSLTYRNDQESGGVRLVQAEVPSLQAWLDASVVLLDELTLALCLERSLPPRRRVLLVVSAASQHQPWVDAVRMGVEQIYVLPTEVTALAAKLEDVNNVLVVAGTERLSGQL